MKEFLDDATEELKRVDHLVYVSLKYTRTVDVLKNTINRIINAFDFIINGLLDNAKKKRKIKDIPISPGLKCELVKKLYSKNEKVNEYMEFYMILRRIMRAEYTKSNEFRRHVTMSAVFQTGKVVDVTMDLVNDYYEYTKKFVIYIDENMKEIMKL